MLMRRRALVTIVLLVVFMLSACAFSYSSYSGIGVYENSSKTSWSISWQKLNGTISHALKFDLEQPAYLKYSFMCNSDDEISISAVQGEHREVLLLGDEAISLENFQSGKIDIVISVKDAGESSFHFEIVK